LWETWGCEHRTVGGIVSPVVVIVGIALSILVWAVSALVMDKWIRRRQRQSLLERLQPYQPRSVADEAQRWLEEQQN
jgi:hypothetical protein